MVNPDEPLKVDPDYARHTRSGIMLGDAMAPHITTSTADMVCTIKSLI